MFKSKREREGERMERAKLYSRHIQRMPLRRKKLSASFFFLAFVLSFPPYKQYKAYISRKRERESRVVTAACMAYSVLHKNSWMIDVCRSRWMRNLFCALFRERKFFFVINNNNF